MKTSSSSKYPRIWTKCCPGGGNARTNRSITGPSRSSYLGNQRHTKSLKNMILKWRALWVVDSYQKEALMPRGWYPSSSSALRLRRGMVGWGITTMCVGGPLVVCILPPLAPLRSHPCSSTYAIKCKNISAYHFSAFVNALSKVKLSSNITQMVCSTEGKVEGWSKKKGQQIEHA